jgi:hypothetical protein
MHLMVLLGEKVKVEARLRPFGHSANLEARWVHCLHQMYHRLGKYFGRT